jgi:hypothetical protein
MTSDTQKKARAVGHFSKRVVLVRAPEMRTNFTFFDFSTDLAEVLKASF